MVLLCLLLQTFVVVILTIPPYPRKYVHIQRCYRNLLFKPLYVIFSSTYTRNWVEEGGSIFETLFECVHTTFLYTCPMNTVAIHIIYF